MGRNHPQIQFVFSDDISLLSLRKEDSVPVNPVLRPRLWFERRLSYLAPWHCMRNYNNIEIKGEISLSLRRIFITTNHFCRTVSTDFGIETRERLETSFPCKKYSEDVSVVVLYYLYRNSILVSRVSPATF